MHLLSPYLRPFSGNYCNCICFVSIDNAESTRNGDVTPTRLIAQQETVNEIVRVQLRSGPENDVALLTTAGRAPALLEPLTREQVTLQKKLYSVQPGGNCQPSTSLRIAQMVLKHRKGLRHGQRVYVAATQVMHPYFPFFSPSLQATFYWLSPGRGQRHESHPSARAKSPQGEHFP